MFGQMGNDVIQGDGGIEGAFAAHLARAARRARRTAAPARRASTSSATTSATSTSSPSFEAATDGEDYIEGDGGNDVDLRRPRPGRHRRRQLGLLQPHGSRELRPDGGDLIFGGAGLLDGPQRRRAPGRHGPRRPPRARRRHDRRRQRRHRPDRRDERRRRRHDAAKYVTFNYDNYGGDAEARRPRRAPARLHAGRPGLPPPTVLRARHREPGCAAAREPVRRGDVQHAAADLLHGDTPTGRASRYTDIGGARRGPRRVRRRHRLHRLRRRHDLRRRARTTT